ncbi:Tpr-related protein family member, putative [Theileria annulata]|uniref:Tpr-related protein family member, putative n=1 Tax=Theileria annulata TaxID=5874 RepID=Q4UI87_THEAN|nr:Tpr-related protein family member, putative [Theileria annulata]CAI73202.1 Tpr-related protein family member, putative [Theileria annulata]|eukprot:XP_953880.1 Tpr-related protein family member, putative [Theileria annulata]
MAECPYCGSANKQAGGGTEDCPYLMAAYVFAGLAMMLNIRLSYSSAPYALIRFRLPENLFSVFVRRMASALELWCLPSMLLGNIMEYGLKGYYQIKNYESDFANGFNLKVPSTINITDSTPKTITIKNLPHVNNTFTPRLEKFYWIVVPSIITQWLNFLTYVILLFVYISGGDQGHLTVFYFVIAISGFVFGINMVLLYAVDWNYIPVYMVGENSFPIVTSSIHYMTTLIFGNRRKWNSDFIIVWIDIWVAIVISLVAAFLWTLAYGYYRNTQKEAITGYPASTSTTITYGTSSECTKHTATPVGKATITDPTDGKSPTLTLNVSDTATNLAAIQETQCNVDVDTTKKTLTIKYGDECITITVGSITKAKGPVLYGHILTEKFDMSTVRGAIISPTLMVIVGMGLVYAIYPGIAPGMIVPFYLVDKIEMVLLIATFFPPVIVALLNRGSFNESTKPYSPKNIYQFHKPEDTENGFGGWRPYKKHVKGSANCESESTIDNWFWHFFDLLIVIKISLAAIFIYSLHYRESAISRSIINQPKMSTILSIIFYMCHEFLLALGFPGVIGNNGSTYVMLPAQYVGALFMIFLAFYSEGYIIEYKSHDPTHWPTESMNRWNVVCI